MYNHPKDPSLPAKLKELRERLSGGITCLTLLV